MIHMEVKKRELATVVHTLVTSRLDYSNVLYVRLPLKMLQKLQLVKMQQYDASWNRLQEFKIGTGYLIYIQTDSFKRGLK